MAQLSQLQRDLSDTAKMLHSDKSSQKQGQQLRAASSKGTFQESSDNLSDGHVGIHKDTSHVQPDVDNFLDNLE